VLHVATCLWDANRHSLAGSRCFNELWVEKLAAGFRRYLTIPHRFVVFTDRDRRFSRGIYQERLTADEPDYGSFTEPYRLNEPMILVGLDTLIIRNIDNLSHYCLTADKIALPRDPYQPDRSINGVALVPAGQRRIWDEWDGSDDMTWLRKQDTAFMDDLFPGAARSFKAHDVRRKGTQGAQVVYFHGFPKPNDLINDKMVRKHWRL
jgi:hypothetical protein